MLFPVIFIKKPFRLHNIWWHTISYTHNITEKFFLHFSLNYYFTNFFNHLSNWSLDWFFGSLIIHEFTNIFKLSLYFTNLDRLYRIFIFNIKFFILTFFTQKLTKFKLYTNNHLSKKLQKTPLLIKTQNLAIIYLLLKKKLQYRLPFYSPFYIKPSIKHTLIMRYNYFFAQKNFTFNHHLMYHSQTPKLSACIFRLRLNKHIKQPFLKRLKNFKHFKKTILVQPQLNKYKKYKKIRPKRYFYKHLNQLKYSYYNKSHKQHVKRFLQYSNKTTYQYYKKQFKQHSSTTKFQINFAYNPLLKKMMPIIIKKQFPQPYNNNNKSTKHYNLPDSFKSNYLYNQYNRHLSTKHNKYPSFNHTHSYKPRNNQYLPKYNKFNSFKQSQHNNQYNKFYSKQPYPYKNISIKKYFCTIPSNKFTFYKQLPHNNQYKLYKLFLQKPIIKKLKNQSIFQNVFLLKTINNKKLHSKKHFNYISQSFFHKNLIYFKLPTCLPTNKNLNYLHKISKNYTFLSKKNYVTNFSLQLYHNKSTFILKSLYLYKKKPIKAFKKIKPIIKTFKYYLQTKCHQQYIIQIPKLYNFTKKKKAPILYIPINKQPYLNKQFILKKISKSQKYKPFFQKISHKSKSTDSKQQNTLKKIQNNFLKIIYSYWFYYIKHYKKFFILFQLFLINFWKSYFLLNQSLRYKKLFKQYYLLNFLHSLFKLNRFTFYKQPKKLTTNLLYKRFAWFKNLVNIQQFNNLLNYFLHKFIKHWSQTITNTFLQQILLQSHKQQNHYLKPFQHTLLFIKMKFWNIHFFTNYILIYLDDTVKITHILNPIQFQIHKLPKIQAMQLLLSGRFRRKRRVQKIELKIKHTPIKNYKRTILYTQVANISIFGVYSIKIWLYTKKIADKFIVK